jgi:hypothetical protein
MAAASVKVGDDMGTIRTETVSAGDLSRTYLWLSRHRGESIELEPGRQLTLGVPISGARAVIIAAVLDNGVGGVIRALSHPAAGGVHLVFDVRSRGGLEIGAVEALAADVLDTIARQIAEDEPVDQVA